MMLRQLQDLQHKNKVQQRKLKLAMGLQYYVCFWKRSKAAEGLAVLSASSRSKTAEGLSVLSTSSRLVQVAAKDSGGGEGCDGGGTNGSLVVEVADLCSGDQIQGVAAKVRGGGEGGPGGRRSGRRGSGTLIQVAAAVSAHTQSGCDCQRCARWRAAAAAGPLKFSSTPEERLARKTIRAARKERRRLVRAEWEVFQVAREQQLLRTRSAENNKHVIKV